MNSTGKELHRFKWLDNEFIDLIGNIPKSWNWLVGEYDYSEYANLVHFTIGTPCFADYKDCNYADEWFMTLDNLLLPMEK